MAARLLLHPLLCQVCRLSDLRECLRLRVSLSMRTPAHHTCTHSSTLTCSHSSSTGAAQQLPMHTHLSHGSSSSSSRHLHTPTVRHRVHVLAHSEEYLLALRVPLAPAHTALPAYVPAFHQAKATQAHLELPELALEVRPLEAGVAPLLKVVAGRLCPAL